MSAPHTTSQTTRRFSPRPLSKYTKTAGAIVQAAQDVFAPFRQTLSVAHLPQPGSFHLQFSSQLTSARNPEEWQRSFGLILKREELEVLRDLIGAAL